MRTAPTQPSRGSEILEQLRAVACAQRLACSLLFSSAIRTMMCAEGKGARREPYQREEQASEGPLPQSHLNQRSANSSVRSLYCVVSTAGVLASHRTVFACVCVCVHGVCCCVRMRNKRSAALLLCLWNLAATLQPASQLTGPFLLPASCMRLNTVMPLLEPHTSHTMRRAHQSSIHTHTHIVINHTLKTSQC
jgi:hypothetical protein